MVSVPRPKNAGQPKSNEVEVLVARAGVWGQEKRAIWDPTQFATTILNPEQKAVAMKKIVITINAYTKPFVPLKTTATQP